VGETLEILAAAFIQHPPGAQSLSGALAKLPAALSSGCSLFFPSFPKIVAKCT
jgi:hypothetical protein